MHIGSFRRIIEILLKFSVSPLFARRKRANNGADTPPANLSLSPIRIQRDGLFWLVVSLVSGPVPPLVAIMPLFCVLLLLEAVSTSFRRSVWFNLKCGGVEDAGGSSPRGSIRVKKERTGTHCRCFRCCFWRTCRCHSIWIWCAVNGAGCEGLKFANAVMRTSRPSAWVLQVTPPDFPDRKNFH